MVVFEDDHAACVVTLWLALFDSVAVTTNCAVAPTTGEVPLTTTADTVTVELEGLVGAPDASRRDEDFRLRSVDERL